MTDEEYGRRWTQEFIDDNDGRIPYSYELINWAGLAKYEAAKNNAKNEQKERIKMKRMFGMMPSEEIEITKKYIDAFDAVITIDAGKNGWTVMYCDGSNRYADVVDTAENNLNEAYKVANRDVGPLVEA